MRIDLSRLEGPGYERDTAIGERHGRSKLTEDDVRLMRHRYFSEGWTMCRCSEASGVNPSTVWKIIRGVTWRHVQ